MQFDSDALMNFCLILKAPLYQIKEERCKLDIYKSSLTSCIFLTLKMSYGENKMLIDNNFFPNPVQIT